MLFVCTTHMFVRMDNRNWKRRWFTLSLSCREGKWPTGIDEPNCAALFYFETDTCESLKGRYPVDYRCRVCEYSVMIKTQAQTNGGNANGNVSANETETNGSSCIGAKHAKYQHHFVLWHPSRNCLQLRAESRQEMLDWMAVLREVIRTAPYYQVEATDAEMTAAGSATTTVVAVGAKMKARVLRRLSSNADREISNQG